jgi:drug/metabolite transporter (DMT)-like permease
VTGRRLLALLCAAFLGVLVVVGLAVTALLGPVGAVVYALVAVALVAVGAVRGRRLLAPPQSPRPAGRTCDCCTTTHFDPVEVIE